MHCRQEANGRGNDKSSNSGNVELNCCLRKKEREKNLLNGLRIFHFTIFFVLQFFLSSVVFRYRNLCSFFSLTFFSCAQIATVREKTFRIIFFYILLLLLFYERILTSLFFMTLSRIGREREREKVVVALQFP